MPSCNCLVWFWVYIKRFFSLLRFQTKTAKRILMKISTWGTPWSGLGHMKLLYSYSYRKNHGQHIDRWNTLSLSMLSRFFSYYFFLSLFQSYHRIFDKAIEKIQLYFFSNIMLLIPIHIICISIHSNYGLTVFSNIHTKLKNIYLGITVYVIG